MSANSSHRDDEGLPFTPVIIIGAGRSGTNALRDMLSTLPSISTWPCDEINPVWRHGNLFWPTDAIPRERATPGVRQFIRKVFSDRWNADGRPPVVLEKTCANALRVPFVERVLPEAKFIHILRSGEEVVPSARKRWQGKMEIDLVPYIIAKVRFTPLRDIPLYGWSFVRNRVARALSKSKSFPSWGPVFDGMASYRKEGLDDVCAAQWAHCVLSAAEALDGLSPDRVLTLRYSDLTGDPAGALDAICRFLEVETDADMRDRAAAVIRKPSGKSAQRPLEIGARAQALVDRAATIVRGSEGPDLS